MIGFYLHQMHKKQLELEIEVKQVYLLLLVVQEQLLQLVHQDQQNTSFAINQKSKWKKDKITFYNHLKFQEIFVLHKILKTKLKCLILYIISNLRKVQRKENIQQMTK